MEPKRTCPECHLIFEAEMPETGVLICPLCNSVFSALSPAGPAPTVSSPLPQTSSGRQVLRGGLAIGAVFFLAGGMGYAYHLLKGIGHKTAVVPVPVAHAPPALPSPRSVEYVPVIPIEPMPQATIQSQPRPPKPQPPATVEKEKLQRPLTLPERVNAAIDRGLAYLRKNHNEHPQYRNDLGLLGLTLLECGVAADDPSVRQIAAWIRSQERQITQTYELTLAILFLDRLGVRRDRVLISNFGQRLLWGQCSCGTWTYSCLVNERRHAQPNFWHAHNPPRQRIAYRGDNSNTQFAILGLWVARRHGVPSSSALLAAEQYFRSTQKEDGSWAYHPNAHNWRDSMTCAGLMGLGMRYGLYAGQGRDNRSRRPVSVHDAAIHRGLRYLAQSLDKITVAGKRIIGAEARNPLYFLWSLERMAVIYDLKRIGQREWYPWAAEMLVETQWPDGRWAGMGDPVGTCFALLVLKRSNLAQDLQLAVQEPTPRPMPDISGPIIRQGPEAFLGQTSKSRGPAPPLGPSITTMPNTK